VTLKGVQVFKSQEAKKKVVDIQILCTDIEAFKKNEAKIKQFKNN